MPIPEETVAILVHGAGSTAEFLTRAFPADQLQVAETLLLDDRSCKVAFIVDAILEQAARVPGPVLIGGVSLGGHAAALALAQRPENAVAGVFALPSWTGAPDHVAELTGAAAEALRMLGIRGVLDDLPTDDWVTLELTRAWSVREDDELYRELSNAALQDAPTIDQLGEIDVPVGLVAMADDPLHPPSVAALWANTISRSGYVAMKLEAPGVELSAFAQAARAALESAFDPAEPVESQATDGQ